MRVVFFGTYDARRHPRIRTIRQGFASLGADVVECNVPLGLDTASRVRMLNQPWRVPILGARLAISWWRLWRMSRSLGHADAVVVGYLGHFDVHLGRWLWGSTPIVLDHLVSARGTAVDRGTRSRWLLWLLDRLDRAALRTADILVVDTDEHLGQLPGPDRRRALIVPVGAPSEWFRMPEPVQRSELRVIFFGLYTPLQGAPVIGRAIALLADEAIRFTMVGSGQDLSATRRTAGDDPKVSWVDWVEAEELPSLVASHDVCLGIFGSGSKAMSVVPNKVFQGAAAGCAIVTADTKPQRAALGDAAIFVPAGDPQALAEALRRLARVPEELRGFREAASQRAREAFRPAVVVQPLHERLREIAS
jgi:glycosyltransferase involved in cell wall biosynthesis